MDIQWMEETKKLFIGGLSWETCPEKLSSYFSKYGQVVDCVVMKNPETGRSRGFGFVTFADPACVQLVLASGPHSLDGRTIDPKSCKDKNAQKVKKEAKNINYPKVFLGGLPSNINETLLRQFFSKYGPVIDVIIMYDQEKKKSRGNGFRGFGFLTFESEEAVNNLVAEHYVTINGKKVEVKRAEPQDKHLGSNNESTKHSSSVPTINSMAGISCATTPGNLGTSYPWWAQLPTATTLVSPAMFQSAQAQLTGTSLVSSVSPFPSSIPWNTMILPTLTGWTPSTGHPTSAQLPGFSVWPSAFNTIGAQAALASAAAAQALGSMGGPSATFPSSVNIGPTYGQTASSASAAANAASPTPGSLPSATAGTLVPTSTPLAVGTPATGGLFAQDASNFGPTRIYGYGFPPSSLLQLQPSPQSADGGVAATAPTATAAPYNANLIPATSGVLRTACSQLSGFHPYRRV